MRRTVADIRPPQRSSALRPLSPTAYPAIPVLFQVVDFATQRLNRSVTVNGCTGPITTFLIEPFVPHSEEFYLSITSTRSGWEVAFSEAGGIHIEEVRSAEGKAKGETIS